MIGNTIGREEHGRPAAFRQTKETTMGIGVGIFLLAVGAVLAFAVKATVAGISIVTIGVILMIVGALGILLDLVLFAPRRRSSAVVTEGYVAPTTTTRRTVEERY